MSKKIMVVDDEPRLVSVVEAYLTQEGFDVATASNGTGMRSLSRARTNQT